VAVAEVTDYRQFFDKPTLRAYDLQGRDVVVTIAAVKQGSAKNKDGERKMPALFFVGKSKPLLLNATNGKTIESMYGKNPKGWLNKQLVIYPTVVPMGPERVDAIRIRPTPPKAGTKDTAGTLDAGPTPEEIAAIRAAEIAEASREPGQEG